MVKLEDLVFAFNDVQRGGHLSAGALAFEDFLLRMERQVGEHDEVLCDQRVYDVFDHADQVLIALGEFCGGYVFSVLWHNAPKKKLDIGVVAREEFGGYVRLILENSADLAVCFSLYIGHGRSLSIRTNAIIIT